MRKVPELYLTPNCICILWYRVISLTCLIQFYKLLNVYDVRGLRRAAGEACLTQKNETEGRPKHTMLIAYGGAIAHISSVTGFQLRRCVDT